jgi:hypothetical protein
MSASHPSRPDPQAAAAWRARLDKAKAEYDLAVAEFRRTAEECRFRQEPTADSESALRKAQRAEATAREHYVRVLQVFTELVVEGKAPPPERAGQTEEGLP